MPGSLLTPYPQPPKTLSRDSCFHFPKEAPLILIGPSALLCPTLGGFPWHSCDLSSRRPQAPRPQLCWMELGHQHPFTLRGHFWGPQGN